MFGYGIYSIEPSKVLLAVKINNEICVVPVFKTLELANQYIFESINSIDQDNYKIGEVTFEDVDRTKDLFSRRVGNINIYIDCK